MLTFVGIDWAEDHHDVCLQDPQGGRWPPAGRPRLDGVALIHELAAERADDPREVIAGIETDRGLLASALLAADYQVYAINPLPVSRHRDRHTVPGAKPDSGDAKLLADVVRADRRNHRPIAVDSDLLAAVKCWPTATKI